MTTFQKSTFHKTRARKGAGINGNAKTVTFTVTLTVRGLVLAKINFSQNAGLEGGGFINGNLITGFRVFSAPYRGGAGAQGTATPMGGGGLPRAPKVAFARTRFTTSCTKWAPPANAGPLQVQFTGLRQSAAIATLGPALRWEGSRMEDSK